ncbi:General substrate transporter [Pleurostoma richardsiae]|uniref:General substrate transporter n=1 Tax=Pleurostoma richardsiae TaxID=41990 RepID=A0AA38RKW2_9PEZI|nr:General substrate transporter [Pleurostoma richardsiae]
MAPKLMPSYVLASVCVSLGGLANGYDTGSIGAIVSTSQFDQSIGHLSPSLLGFTVSLIMLTASVPSVFAGHLADKFGRLRIIQAGAALFAVGAALQGTSHQLGQFLAGRALAGLGEGIYLGNMSVYICEIAPVKTRGMLAGFAQCLVTAGICAGYFTCYGTVTIQSSMAWRLPFVVQGIISAVLALACLVLPDSPRWLLLHGRRNDALLALQRLEFPMVEAERDFLAITEQRPSLSPWHSLVLLFKRGYRTRTVLALFILGMVQLSGIDGVIYYAPTLFSQAGLSTNTASFLASGLSAILMLAISVPAFLLVDKWGRRTCAITGGLTLSGCMMLMGCLYAAGAVHAHGIARWVVIVSVFVFGLTYCATWAIVGKIYASEIQPGHTRAAANAVAQGLNFFTNWLVAILTPILLDKSSFGAYFLFGGLSLGTVGVLAAYMPETRGRSLEDIQEAFHQPKVKSLAQHFKSIVPRQRRGAQNIDNGGVVEMDDLDQTGPAATSSVETVVRGLRVDVAMP